MQSTMSPGLLELILLGAGLVSLAVGLVLWKRSERPSGGDLMPTALYGFALIFTVFGISCIAVAGFATLTGMV
ncbi:membrane protein [Microbacterium phage Hendrix]|uniref:Uncharacterized protein n=1 Tax=Microbacterium phage Hendrix TaxID=2182341 RepID=A0A2U8UUF8_9CAUD|nr:membrane protein [Microbacterium phage Hendrix]AWN07717.1 hypothetical protein PBI_HENDRIX_46 [Microbacterium phage Hendrix]